MAQSFNDGPIAEILGNYRSVHLPKTSSIPQQLWGERRLAYAMNRAFFHRRLLRARNKRRSGAIKEVFKKYGFVQSNPYTRTTRVILRRPEFMSENHELKRLRDNLYRSIPVPVSRPLLPVETDAGEMIRDAWRLSRNRRKLASYGADMRSLALSAVSRGRPITSFLRNRELTGRGRC